MICKLLVLSAGTASATETGRFAAPVSDSKELELRSTAIPQKTKSQTIWGIGLEWMGKP